MLPKNQLRREHMRKLRVFPDEEHPFQHLGDRLVPFEMPPRALKRSEGEDAYRLKIERNDEGGDATTPVAKFQSGNEGGDE